MGGMPSPPVFRSQSLDVMKFSLSVFMTSRRNPKTGNHVCASLDSSLGLPFELQSFRGGSKVHGMRKLYNLHTQGKFMLCGV